MLQCFLFPLYHVKSKEAGWCTYIREVLYRLTERQLLEVTAIQVLRNGGVKVDRCCKHGLEGLKISRSSALLLGERH